MWSFWIGKEHKSLGTPCPGALFHLHTVSSLTLWSYLLLLGGVRAPLFLLTAPLTVPLRPRLPRTCFSIQARRFVRLLCSDSTIRGHGLHSAMSRAAMAIARPTCGVVQGAQHLGLPAQAACWGGSHSTVEGKERPGLKFSQWVPQILCQGCLSRQI